MVWHLQVLAIACDMVHSRLYQVVPYVCHKLFTERVRSVRKELPSTSLHLQQTFDGQGI